MAFIVDIVILLIIGLCIFLGYKNGLAKSLLKLCTTIIALILAIMLYKPVVNFVVNKTTIDENIQLSIERIMKNGAEKNENDDTQIVKEDSGMPKPIVEYLNNNFKSNVETQKEQAISTVSRNAALLIVDIACVIVVYLAAKVILKILTIVTDIITKIPLIKQFNEAGGIIFGILEGLLIVLIILTLISVISPLTGNYSLSNLVSESFIGNFLYNNNIILNLIF